ncbi:MAG: zinc ribbon domain-containing protein [Ktedonobacteraceae bacterium]|nr:zinc ribbon domain-containing protein [Ktedonobacteraceae bacterium]
MPTYEYLCQACSHRFETWQRMIEEPLTTCPECGGHIRRVLFPAGIVFKGSGFYKTDHGSGAHGNGHAAREDDGNKPTTDGKAETKTASNESTATTSEKPGKSDKQEPASTATKP